MNKEHLESNNKKLEELETLSETLKTTISHTKAVVEQAISFASRFKSESERNFRF